MIKTIFLKCISAYVGDKLNLIQTNITDLKKNTREIKSFKMEYNALKSYHKNIRKVTLSQIKYKRIKDIQSDIDLDPLVISIACSRIAEMPFDDVFDSVYDCLKNKINIDLLSRKLPIQLLFPQHQEVNLIAWQETLEMVIRHISEHLPDKVQKLILHNNSQWKLITF